MPVYRVLASRSELYLIEAHVRAADRDAAELRFYEVLAGEGDALSWIQDFDSSETEIDSVESIGHDHDAVPSQDRAL